MAYVTLFAVRAKASTESRICPFSNGISFSTHFVLRSEDLSIQCCLTGMLTSRFDCQYRAALLMNSAHIGAGWTETDLAPMRLMRQFELGQNSMGQTAREIGTVVSVSACADHNFSKPCVDQITLVKGFGIEGDAHAGKTVQHRSRVAVDPSQPNLRQVHLIAEELHEELQEQGFRVGPGLMGENITTRGVDLISLPRGTRMRIGEDTVLEITGLRNPCKQLDDFQSGLLGAVLDRLEDGSLIRKAGIMAIVEASGTVIAGDKIHIRLPSEPHVALDRV